MSSQNELLQALVNELPYVQSLVSEIRDLKKLSYSELAKKIVYPFIGNFTLAEEVS